MATRSVRVCPVAGGASAMPADSSAVLERARERGEIRKVADLEAAVSALLGPFSADYMAGRG
ncbi:hypothetical protein [Streptomyces sp. 7N604]|uniref:hypothetical protein n=1 Tax=Streptomyces sp. 7N604 TaxID=3457415 RepID=UPI003FD483C5